MNFVELIEHVKSIPQAEELLSIELPDVEYCTVMIYMKEELGLDSEVVFFDAEAISNDLVMTIDGIRYVSLFTLSLTQEMVEECEHKYNPKLSNEEIAKLILNYYENDA